jgi:hypothetical protein
MRLQTKPGIGEKWQKKINNNFGHLLHQNNKKVNISDESRNQEKVVEKNKIKVGRFVNQNNQRVEVSNSSWYRKKME